MWFVLLSLCLAGSIGISTGAECYGDVKKVDTKGASSKTAKQDGLNYSGVRASEQMAKTDLKRMNTLKSKILSVGLKLCMDPAVIAGIISRESRGGNALKNGWGDGGNAFGVMQVDKRYHKIIGTWNSEEHLSQGTEILINMIKAIRKTFPNWSLTQQLKGGTAAYNTGSGNVKSYNEVDSRTTGHDYSNDVMARAKYYKSEGY